MNTFEVNDMTCGHCVGVITKAVKAVAPGADLHIDLATHRVTIDGTELDSVRLGKAIKDAGFSPMAVDSVVGTSSSAVGPAHRGCCCG